MLRGAGHSLSEEVEKRMEKLLITFAGLVFLPLFLLYGQTQSQTAWLGLNLWIWLFIFLAGGFACSLIVSSMAKKLFNHYLGLKGERWVGDILNWMLKDGFEVFHDFPIEPDGRTGNIDHILVGPNGVFAIETKTYRKPTEAADGKNYEVKFLHHVAIETALRLASEAIGSIDDGMHHRVGQIEDKRFLWVPLLLQVLNRLVRIKGGQFAHVPAASCRLVVLVKLHTPAIVRSECAEVVIKALCIGHPVDNRLAVGDIPLAYARGLVAPLAHQLPKSDLTGGHSPSLATTRIAACQQGGTRGSANRLGIEGSEARSFLG